MKKTVDKIICADTMTDDMTSTQRFMRYVEKKESGCWIWTACLNSSGYATFRDGGKAWLAHRWSYEKLGHKATAPELHHTCRVRRCVNFEHVEPTESLAHPDKPSVLNLLKTECPNGHAYDAENTYVDPIGHRHCRICRNRAASKSYRKNWKNARACQKAYYAKNRAKIDAKKREWYKRRKVEILAAS